MCVNSLFRQETFLFQAGWLDGLKIKNARGEFGKSWGWDVRLKKLSYYGNKTCTGCHARCTNTLTEAAPHRMRQEAAVVGGVAAGLCPCLWCWNKASHHFTLFPLMCMITAHEYIHWFKAGSPLLWMDTTSGHSAIPHTHKRTIHPSIHPTLRPSRQGTGRASGPYSLPNAQ